VRPRVIISKFHSVCILFADFAFGISSTICWGFDDMSPTKSAFRPAGPRFAVWSLFALLLAFTSVHNVEGTCCATFINVHGQIPIQLYAVLYYITIYLAFHSQRNHAARQTWTAMWARVPISPTHACRHALRGPQAWATPGWTVYLTSNKQGC
jgi:hypothetical protein